VTVERSRHLVDPELAHLLDPADRLDLSAERLAAVRKILAPVDIRELPRDSQDGYGLRITHVIPGFGGDPEVRVVRYQPDVVDESSGALLWIHGGGLVAGAVENDDDLCALIARVCQAIVISVDYRLAPETCAPGALHDCYAALQWLHASASEFRVDRSRVAVGGTSAGGGLAASLAILARDRAEVPVAAQVLIHPMLDDRTGSTRAPHPYAGEYVWTSSDNVYAWGAHLGSEPGGDAVSPYLAAARVDSMEGLPPTFLTVGALDLFGEEVIDYALRLVQAGVPTELHVYPGAVHGYPRAKSAQVSRAHEGDLLAALNRLLGG